MKIDRPNPNQVIKLAPKRFLKQIPNRNVMREFLITTCKFYTPPERDLSTQFCKDILSGMTVINMLIFIG